MDRALGATEPIPSLSGNKTAQKSCHLFYIILQAPITSRPALHGSTHKRDMSVPWVKDPQDILAFHFNLATRGVRSKPIHNSLPAMAFTEALKRSDPMEFLFDYSVCYGSKPFQLHEVSLSSFYRWQVIQHPSSDYRS